MMEFISDTPMFNQNSLEQEDLTWMFGNLKKDQMLRVLYTQTPLKKGEMVTYCFKIQLRGITKPPVWRKVEVPSQFTFGAFHLIIQAAFGWYNYRNWRNDPKALLCLRFWRWLDTWYKNRKGYSRKAQPCHLHKRQRSLSSWRLWRTLRMAGFESYGRWTL